MKSRGTLRSEMRGRRRALPPAERVRAAESRARHLGNSLLARRARQIACYLCNDGELDPGPALDRLREDGARVLLPVLRGGALWFFPYEHHTPLTPNRFGIPEPRLSARTRTRAQELDLVLVPLVAFDTCGNRLGMGGGFYDRTFAFLRNRNAWQKPRLIGIAYEFQRLESLPSRDWDVPLHGVATEKRLYRFDKRAPGPPM